MNCSVKKRYTAPSLESIAIDQEIALVMMSPPTGGGGLGEGEGAPSAPTTKTTKKASPFGGTKPDYSNMQ
jgi:hypothetical protein